MLKTELEATVIACLELANGHDVWYTGFFQTSSGDSRQFLSSATPIFTGKSTGYNYWTNFRSWKRDFSAILYHLE